MITVSYSWTESILDFALFNGAKESDISDMLGFDCSRLRRDSFGGKTDSRISIEDVVKLWSACSALSGDRYFGLTFGKHIRAKDLDVVGFMLMTSRNLSQALEQLVKYQSIVSQGGLIGLSKGGGLIDLWTVIPILLLIAGGRKIMTERTLTMPAAVTLLWWSYNSLFHNKPSCG